MRPIRTAGMMRRMRRNRWEKGSFFRSVRSALLFFVAVLFLLLAVRLIHNVITGQEAAVPVEEINRPLEQVKRPSEQGEQRAELSPLEKRLALFLWNAWYPAASLEQGPGESLAEQLSKLLLGQVPYYRDGNVRAGQSLPGEPDPAYHNYLENNRMLKEYELLVMELEDSSLMAAAGSDWSGTYGSGQSAEAAQSGGISGPGGSPAAEAIGTMAGESLLSRGILNENGIRYMQEQLADYDFLMKHFYTVHPTAAASREFMKAAEFLDKDFSLKRAAQEDEGPQILIYHTHSQEEYTDFHKGNKEATVVGIGNYLTELLTQKGYRVIHDTTVYDLRDGNLDRSRAYTYALDGITAILQKNPSIQVVLDLHRDGVKPGTHLVTEVNGKPTAAVMFFNGTSETPEGPIEYLKNPYRTDNLAFSFQMKLCADACYPGYTRKTYIKGLRYNQHVRPAASLIEVGAQTNSYEEARNAMEPLAEILDMVLGGENEE